MRALSHSHDRLYQRRRADDIRNDKQTDIPRRWSDSRRRCRDKHEEDCLPARGSDSKVQWGCTHACDYWSKNSKRKGWSRFIKHHVTACSNWRMKILSLDKLYKSLFGRIDYVWFKVKWPGYYEAWGARVRTRQGNNRRKMTVMTRYDDTSFPGWESSDGYRYRICVGQLRRRQDLKSHEIQNSFETRSKHDR